MLFRTSMSLRRAVALAACVLLSGVTAWAQQQAYFASSGSTKLDWNVPPHPNATGNLIFNTVSSLMQMWPNLLWRRGHTIALAHIPTGTLLHHGLITPNGPIPTEPDWLAFDSEHSYFFGAQHRRMHTFMASRNLKLLYFDGNSAANEFGMMETADLIAWGEIRPETAGVEYECARIVKLCEWAKSRGLDGFIRMEFHFEVMYCDFSDGLELVETIDLLPTTDNHWPWNWMTVNCPTQDILDQYEGRWPPPDASPIVPPTGWQGTLPTANDAAFQAIVSGSWHYNAPGETRVVIDWAGVVSLYDPALQSLVGALQGLPRSQHSLAAISREDIERKLDEVSDMVTRESHGSGVNWGSMARTIIERYSKRLLLLNGTLADTSSFANIITQAKTVRSQLLVMLTPYFHVNDFRGMSSNEPEHSDHSWLAPVVARCSRRQLSHIPTSRLTYQESVIFEAVGQTTHEICRRLALMWASAFAIEDAEEATVVQAIEDWKVHTTELMAWLDWPVWHTCRPACKANEWCYISTWPWVVTGDRLSDTTPRCLALDSSVVLPGWGKGNPRGLWNTSTSMLLDDIV